MLATDEKEGPPMDSAGLTAHGSGDVVRVNDGAAGKAVAAVVSEPHTNVVALKSGTATPSKLLPRWKLIGRAACDARLSRSDIAVLYVITDRIGDTGTAWPSVRRIADDASADPRTVTRSINRLCDCGYLLRKSGGFTTANEYRLGVGEPAPTGKATRTGEPVAGYGRTRPEGMGEPAYVIFPVNPPNESAQGSSTAAPLTAAPGEANAGGESKAERKKTSVAARAARLAQVTRDAIETFNASPLTKANGGLVPNVDPDIGADKRQKQVAKCLAVARDICRKLYGGELIVREFWADYWAACHDDEHKSGRAGGGKDHGNWIPTFEYLTREATLLEVYDRDASAAAAGGAE